jgi:hypothetical protein
LVAGKIIAVLEGRKSRSTGGACPLGMFQAQLAHFQRQGRVKVEDFPQSRLGAMGSMGQYCPLEDSSSRELCGGSFFFIRIYSLYRGDT